MHDTTHECELNGMSQSFPGKVFPLLEMMIALKLNKNNLLDFL
jgi:hypothetical protein